MRTIFIFLISLTILAGFSSCNNEQKKSEVNSLLNNDVPKFINAVPSLSHDDMELAFKQANLILKYKVKEQSSSVGAHEAWSETEENKNLILSVSKLLPQSDANEFGVSLTFFPSLKDSVLFYKVNALMTNYKKTEFDGKPTWLVNNRLLQIDGSKIIYFPITTKSIFDLFKESI